MKKAVLVVLLVVIVFVGSVMDSCESSTYQEISPEVTNPTYSVDIAPIFSSKCGGCHNDLGSYIQVKNAILNRNVVCRIESESCGIMPPQGKMPQYIVDMIKRWRDQEYVN
jgi:hypothetical protein